MGILKSVQDEVQSKIIASSEQVKELVIKKMIQTEVARRADILEKGVLLSVNLTTEGLQIKPDSIIYNDQGDEVSSGWTKGMLDKKAKHKKKCDELNKLIDGAMAKDATEKNWKNLSTFIDKHLK